MIEAGDAIGFRGAAPRRPRSLILSSNVDLAWLARGLERHGHEVEVHGSDGEMPEMVPVASDSLRADDYQLILHCHMPTQPSPGPITKLDHAQWAAQCEEPARRTLQSLQLAQSHIAANGAIVGLGPAFALNGTAGLAGFSMALETQRTLVKSAARQWASRAFSINWVALAPARLVPGLADADGIGRFVVGPDLRRPPADEPIAALLAMLATGGGAALNGQTLVADGGEWMVP